MAQEHSRLERQMLAACQQVTTALDNLKWLFEDNMDADLTQLRIELDERLELRDQIEADYQFYSKYVLLLMLAPEE
ncbi:MAG: hypothetical protein LUP95_02855 [Euryarchaeota archaeon]|nr:hypothetical protein [Euryarchaeota archaeon]